MNTLFEIPDLLNDINDIKTPTDKRTTEYKSLNKRVKEITSLHPDYGYFSYFRLRDINLFLNNFENNLN